MAVRYKDFTNEQMAQMLAQQPMNTAMQTQAQPTVTTQTQSQQKGGLEGFLGGIGQTIGNFGTSLAGLIGGGVAGFADLVTGNTAKSITTDELRKLYDKTGAKGYLDLINKAANDGRVRYTGDLSFDPTTGEVRGYELANEGKNQDAFKKMLYGTDASGNNPNYAKAAGQAFDAAATLSNFIPGANGGASMAKALGFNALQGAASGFGQAYADTGGDLESALKAAAAGGAAGAATGGLNKGLNNAIAKGGKLANFATSKPLASTILRGGLSGAVGGAVGGGTAAGLNNGDILAGAAQGAGSGLGGGLIAAPVMYGVNKMTSKIPGIGGAQAALNEMDQDYQTAKQNGQKYYGFGSDNKAETAPGSLKDTYVAGDMIEGAEKVGNYVADKIKNPMIGNGIKDLNNRLAFAGSENIPISIDQSESGIMSSTVIKGGAPDGGNLVKTDYNLPDNLSRKDINKAIKETIAQKFQGNSYNVGNTDMSADITNRTKNELSFKQTKMSNKDFAKKGSMVGNLDEMIENMTDVKEVKNFKKNTKPNVDHYVSGRVAVDLGDGEVYYPRVDIEVNKNGKMIGYDIADIKKAPRSNQTNGSNSGGQTRVGGTELGHSSILPQEGENVNTDNQTNAYAEAQKKLLSVKSRKQKETAAKDLINQLGTVSKPAAKAYRMIDNAVTLSERGLTTPEQWEIAADSITGRNGKISKLHTKVTASAGQIDTWNGVNGKSLDQTIDKIIGDNGIAGTDEKAIRREIQGALGMLPSRQDGSLTGTDDASDVMDVIRTLEANERDYLGTSGDNYSTTDSLDRRKAKVLGSVANILEDRIYDKIGDVSPLMTKEVIGELKNIFPGNKKWANYVDNDIATIKTGKELRAAQKPYVQTSNYLKSVKENFGTYGQRVGDVYGNAAAQALKKVPVVGSILAQAADSPIANRAYAKVHNIQADMLDKQANRLSSQTPRTTTGPTQASAPETLPGTMLPVDRLANAIGRAEGARAAGKSLETQLANMNTQEGTNATQAGMNGDYYSGADVYGNATMPTANTGMGGMYGSPYSQNDDYLSRIEIGIQNAFNAGDFDSVEYLIDMYNSVSKMYQTNEKDMSNPINWSSADKKSLLEAQDWLSKIDDLEAVYNQAGGAKGSGDLLNIGGRVADFTAGINADKEGKNYQSYANSIGMGIIKSLVNMGGTEYDAERYLDYLPKLSDTKEQAKQKLDVLRNSYQSVINNLYRINQL